MTARLEQVFAAIDEANAADPTMEPAEYGEAPKALLHGRRMSEALDDLAPDASEVLRIAARGQHIERWRLARADYPEGRAGYLRWRRDQARAHGERLAEMMAEAGYSEAEQARVGALVRKEGLKRDPEAQMLEDAICFVFVRWEFAGFAAKHPWEKVVDIVAKTARKMSAAGRARLLREFDLPDELVAAFGPAGTVSPA